MKWLFYSLTLTTNLAIALSDLYIFNAVSHRGLEEYSDIKWRNMVNVGNIRNWDDGGSLLLPRASPGQKGSASTSSPQRGVTPPRQTTSRGSPPPDQRGRPNPGLDSLMSNQPTSRKSPRTSYASAESHRSLVSSSSSDSFKSARSSSSATSSSGRSSGSGKSSEAAKSSSARLSSPRGSSRSTKSSDSDNSNAAGPSREAGQSEWSLYMRRRQRPRPQRSNSNPPSSQNRQSRRSRARSSPNLDSARVVALPRPSQEPSSPQAGPSRQTSLRQVQSTPNTPQRRVSSGLSWAQAVSPTQASPLRNSPAFLGRTGSMSWTQAVTGFTGRDISAASATPAAAMNGVPEHSVLPSQRARIESPRSPVNPGEDRVVPRPSRGNQFGPVGSPRHPRS